MTSEKQLAANRRNALRSTGPKTAEGKERSSRNNLRHGLTGHITVLPSEDREAHDCFVGALLDSLNPETLLERQLAQSIAEDTWRLNRVYAIETNIYALGRANTRNEIERALADAQTHLDHANEFNLLSTYDQRINRNRQRNLNQLRELQAERAEQHRRALEEAQLLAQQSLVNGLAYEPRQDGFVFSSAEINRAIDRNNRLQEARNWMRAPESASHAGSLRVTAARAA